mgnify:CR=1 FL=1
MWSQEPDKKELERHIQRAKLVLDLYKEAGLDAMTVGSEDLLLTPAKIKSLARAAGVTVLSANLKSPSGTPYFKATKMLDRGGVKVGVLAITQMARHMDKRLEEQKLKFDDPVETAKKLAKKLKADGAQYIILLAAADRKQTQKILSATPEIHLALISGRGGWMREPQKVGDAFMVGVPPGGKNVGQVELHRTGDSFVLEDISGRHTIRNRIDRLLSSCSRYHKFIKRAKGDRKGRYAKRLVSMQKNILQLIDKLKKEVKSVPKAGYFSHKRVALKKNVKDDPAWKKRVAETKKKYNLDNRKNRFRRRPPVRSLRTRRRRRGGVSRGRFRRGKSPVMSRGSNAMSLPPGER